MPRFVRDELAHARHLLHGVVEGALHAGVSFGRFGVAIEQELGRRLCASLGAAAAAEREHTIGATLVVLRDLLTRRTSAC